VSRLSLLAGAGLGLLITTGLALRGLLYLPGPVEPVAVQCPADTPVARAGQELTVLVWNVQFAGSTRHHFFYDGGQAVHVPAEDVTWSLDRIAEVVREIDPDVILFQEIDRDSDRTGGVDQHRELLARLHYPCHATAPYHRVPYVPSPDHEHMGRVDMHLAVLSRVRLDEARRHQLPLLDEPWWRRLFNLRRAVLEVQVPVQGGPDLALLDTHLSAFSHGDGTLPRQIEAVRRLALRTRDAGRAVVLAGDFNALPPGDDPTRLPPADHVLYQVEGDQDSPITPLYQDLVPALPLEAIRRRPERSYTYAPYGLGRVDRMIDHVFTAGPVEVHDVSVQQDRHDISDHMPIVVELTPDPEDS